MQKSDVIVLANGAGSGQGSGAAPAAVSASASASAPFVASVCPNFNPQLLRLRDFVRIARSACDIDVDGVDGSWSCCFLWFSCCTSKLDLCAACDTAVHAPKVMAGHQRVNSQARSGVLGLCG